MRLTAWCVLSLAWMAGAAQAGTLRAAAAAPPPGQPTAASPDATRVSVASASVHARCDEGSPVRTILGRGETVTILAYQDNWVQVRVTAMREEGCMRRSLLEPIPAMDRADAARRARQAAGAPGAPRPPASRARGQVSVNFGWQAASDSFSESRTFPLYQETARYTSSYEVKSNSSFDVGGAVRVWRSLGVGVAVTRFEDTRDIAIQGTLPHPFFFQRDRAISGTAPGRREELATHVDAVFAVPVGRRLEVLVFGGPSFFTVKQSVVTDLNYSEQFPFDTAAFSPATVAIEKENRVGFNVGADVGYYFTDLVGVGGIVRFARARVPFQPGELDAGGASVGGGVRIRFR